MKKAVINSTRTVFNLKNKACFFHLSRNIWKKVQNEKMVSEYITNSEFQKLVKSLVALAFLTPAKIPIAFNILKPKLELACFPLYKYFEKMYIWGKVKKVTCQKTYYHDPCFPPSLRSVYENNQLGIPWTSNHAEAFHWKFSRRVLQKKLISYS